MLTKTLIGIYTIRSSTKLDYEETIPPSEKLYDPSYLYSPGGWKYGGSDQNNRITFVLEVRDDALAQPEVKLSVFPTDGDDFVGGRMEGPSYK